MQRVKFTLIVLVVVLGAMVGYGYGCGGSDGDSGGTGDTTAANSSNESGDGGDGASSGPLTEAQFIQQANAICAKVPQRYNRLYQQLEREMKGTRPTTAEGNLKAAIPPIPEAVEELEALTPPAGHEAEVEAIVAALEAAQKGMEEAPASQLSGPQSPFAEFQNLTREYGLQTCSRL